nr:hypothetical protein [Tanacetum cinerariifolium]
MKITQLDIPAHQMNTKFVNNLPLYWARTSSNSRSHATVHDGQIVTEIVQRKAPGNVGNTGSVRRKKRVKDSQYFKDKMLLMEAKEKGAVLDTEAKAFLADVECIAPYD